MRLVLEVSRPDNLQRLETAQLMTTDRRDIKPGVRVINGFGKVHFDSTERVHHVRNVSKFNST